MNAICPRMSPFSTPRICPFLTMFMTSYPCNVFHAVSKEKKPSPGLTRRLMKRWCAGYLEYPFVNAASFEEFQVAIDIPRHLF